MRARTFSLRGATAGFSRERTVLAAVWSLGAAGILLGLARPPNGSANPSVAGQALDLIRILCTTALSAVLVLGPGLAIRAGNRRRLRRLGFVPLPGLALLVGTGSVAWVLAPTVAPRAVCAAVAVPALSWMLLRLWMASPEDLLDPGEQRALAIAAGALGVAVGRTIWSLGPPGELLGGTTFRTLEVGERSDSAIAFRIVQLIAAGHSPYGALAKPYFGAFTFSARGPLSGLAAAPVALLAGGRPPVAPTGGPWSPFDGQGFMAYRLLMMTLACTSLLALWTLARELAGERAAYVAALLGASTPFVVHEVWFTWPKLLAATFVLLAATSIVRGRPLTAGLLLGLGYLAHPLALFSLPALVLVVIWPPPCLRARRGAAVAGSTGRAAAQRVRAALLMLSGLAAWLVAWRVVNWAHYNQADFLHYLTASGSKNLFIADVIRSRGGHPAPPPLSAWISDRLVSLGNTVVPMRAALLSPQDLNATCGLGCQLPFATPFVVHFFLQYWLSVPFALGILFLPVWVPSLWRAARRSPWAVTAALVVPFAVFLVYWGGASTGLLREGLHPWLLTLVLFVALEQHHRGYSWWRSGLVRVLLVLRAGELLLLAMLPTLVTRHRVLDPTFVLTDVAAVAVMLAAAAWLGRRLWLGSVDPV